ncbi:hypothetical protein GCM10022221_22390 [Actinocorallia aurea]
MREAVGDHHPAVNAGRFLPPGSECPSTCRRPEPVNDRPEPRFITPVSGVYRHLRLGVSGIHLMTTAWKACP